MNKKLQSLKLSFSDFDDFAEMISQAEIEHFKLEKGEFSGSISQVFSDKMIVGIHTMNSPILQQGAGKKGFTTFLILKPNCVDLQWRNNFLGSNRIGILRGGMDHKCVTMEKFEGTPISISDTYLNEFSRHLGYFDFVELLHKKECHTIDARSAQEIYHLVKRVCFCGKSSESEFHYQLPKLLITAINNSWSRNEKVKLKNKSGLFFEIQNYIESNIEHEYSIFDLCEEFNVNERSLRYLFNRKVGISPKKYVQNLKLNKVRKLIKSNQDQDYIKAIAFQYGFWHSGQFASDYKGLFGELPSKTKFTI